jgi:hypothetical protein
MLHSLDTERASLNNLYKKTNNIKVKSWREPGQTGWLIQNKEHSGGEGTLRNEGLLFVFF